jgi:hypothetical protein
MLVSTTASMRNCQRISCRRAPSALRTPISRVRSVTERANAVAQRLIEAANERRHAHDGGDTNDDTQHGERRAQLVEPQCIEGHHDDLAEKAPIETHGVW